jgi:iron complex transport system substrate-binding protein
MMKARFSKMVSLAVFVLVFLCNVASLVRAENPAELPKRIISLAPSTTEVLFALGLGDQVVGVTRYCDYPAPALSIAKVGGFLDPNYEEIVALKPDVTILLTSRQDVKRELGKLGVTTITVPHQTIGDIPKAIHSIGEVCGVKDRALAMVETLHKHSQAVSRAIEGRPRPRILVCIGRDPESGLLTGMYMAGRNRFYDEIIELAGGINVCEDEKVAYPQLSAEGVIQLNPDVIVDLVSRIKPVSKAPEEIIRQWDTLRVVTAVRKGRVYAIVGNHALRPGPRYIEFPEHMASLLHPHVYSNDSHP